MFATVPASSRWSADALDHRAILPMADALGLTGTRSHHTPNTHAHIQSEQWINNERSILTPAAETAAPSCNESRPCVSECLASVSAACASLQSTRVSLLLVAPRSASDTAAVQLPRAKHKELAFALVSLRRLHPDHWEQTIAPVRSTLDAEVSNERDTDYEMTDRHWIHALTV